MTLDPEILRSSFELVVARNPDVVRRFYDLLFERYPAVRPLFGNVRAQQERMLTFALAAVIEHLEDAPWLATTLGSLGRRHVGYGVTDEMYDQVGAALITTLARAAGPHWTPELESQWSAAYGAIAAMMKAGSAAQAA